MTAEKDAAPASDTPRFVERYDAEGKVDPDGCAVAYSDYAELERELAALRKALEEPVNEDDKEALRMVHIMMEAPVGNCCLTRSVTDGRLCMAAFSTIEPAEWDQ